MPTNPARKLAEKMAEQIVGGGTEMAWEQEIERAIPYATALLAAEEALDEAAEYLGSNTPSNSYGLIDHSADRERSKALVSTRAALATIKALLPNPRV